MRACSHLLVLLGAGALMGMPASPLAQQKQEREAATPPAQLNEVGQGTHLGRQPLKPGAYITPRYRKAVRQYLARHHGSGKPCLPGVVKQGAACRAGAGGGNWQIGKALPRGAQVQPLPAGLAAALPKAPPGTRYVLLAGDILLMASGSRIVVDAVPAGR